MSDVRILNTFYSRLTYVITSPMKLYQSYLFIIQGFYLTCWNIKTGEEIMQFKNPTGGCINDMMIENQKIFIVTQDGYIMKIHIESGEIEKRIKVCKSLNSIVGDDNDNIFTGSYLGTIKQWSMKNLKYIKTFRNAHSQKINNLIMWKGFLFSGSDDKQMKKWDITTGKCLQCWTFQSKVQDLQISNNGNFSFYTFERNIERKKTLRNYTDYKDKSNDDDIIIIGNVEQNQYKLFDLKEYNINSQFLFGDNHLYFLINQYINNKIFITIFSENYLQKYYWIQIYSGRSENFQRFDVFQDRILVVVDHNDDFINSKQKITIIDIDPYLGLRLLLFSFIKKKKVHRLLDFNVFNIIKEYV